jgi:hypothetical protein
VVGFYHVDDYESWLGAEFELVFAVAAAVVCYIVLEQRTWIVCELIDLPARSWNSDILSIGISLQYCHKGRKCPDQTFISYS